MKQRTYEKPSEEKKLGLKCSTLGQLPRWQMMGYVQDITVNRRYSEDYVKFCIKESAEAKYYEVFSVTLPHEVGIELQVGDHVLMTGSVRTWPIKNENGVVCGRKIELICLTVSEVGEDYG